MADNRAGMSSSLKYFTGPEVVKLFFLLNSAEHKCSLLIDMKLPRNWYFHIYYQSNVRAQICSVAKKKKKKKEFAIVSNWGS